MDDIQAVVATLVERGVEFYGDESNRIFDVGPKLVASFKDPNGTWYQLSQPNF